MAHIGAGPIPAISIILKPARGPIGASFLGATLSWRRHRR
jgi:hypothetical protein